MKKKILSLFFVFVLLMGLANVFAANYSKTVKNPTNKKITIQNKYKQKNRYKKTQNYKKKTVINNSNKNASNTNKKQNIQAVNSDRTKSSDKLNKDIKAAVNNKQSKKNTKKEDTRAKDKTTNKKTLTENGSYSSKEDVALYIHTYGKLPSNYISKSQAYDIGWEPRLGNLWGVAKGKSIGGDRFSNRERTLPYKQGRQYYECDIDYDGGHRGAKRIVYSNDGLVYYTEDHYATFTLLYGQENM
jgi:ribonuclease